MTGQNHKESWISKNNSLEFHDLSTVVIKLLQKFTAKGFKSVFSEEEIFKYGLSLQIEGMDIAKLGLQYVGAGVPDWSNGDIYKGWG